MANATSGSCLCGAVTFDVTGAFENFFLCHCARCRKDTGSAHAANLFSTSAGITWRTGADNIATFRLPETRHVKSFCRDCGAALPTEQRGLLIVPAGSLDTPVGIRPTAHICCASRADWDHDLDAVKKIDSLPS